MQYAPTNKYINMDNIILISACLLGLHTRYDGKDNLRKELLEEFEDYILIPICPEQLGGLSTPRPPAEIIIGSGEDVLAGKSRICTNEENIDVTAQFIRGAQETLYLIKLLNCKKIILKQRSPSCGYGQIVRKGKTIKGNGITSALLLQYNIEIIAKD